jgi:hypothetical protein
MAKKSKRVVIISDLHSGHLVGLTPPKFDIIHESPEYHKLDRLRRVYWDFYAKEIQALMPIDILIVNGDCIDGKGKKSGGTELIEADATKQCTIAEEAIEFAKARHNFLTFGTAYHVGDESDMERKIATDIEADKIGSHDWLDVNGLVFDYKHHASSSIIPHGRHTAIARERLWNMLWNEWDECPKANIIIRSHVHYFNYCGGYGWLAMTTPALQGYGSKLGSRICSGTVDFGFVHFDVTDKDNYSWTPHIMKLKQSKQAITVS